eukprot:5498102-Pyramimonas_sp.AAC.1
MRTALGRRGFPTAGKRLGRCPRVLRMGKHRTCRIQPCRIPLSAPSSSLMAYALASEAAVAKRAPRAIVLATSFALWGSGACRLWPQQRYPGMPIS